MRWILAILLFALVACKYESSTKDKHGVGSTNKIKRENLQLEKWVEYKKEPVINPWDTLPYPNTFLIIELDSLRYYNNGVLTLTDKIVQCGDKNSRVFKLMSKPEDMLFFYGENRKYCKWTQNSFEGLYEYFIKI